MIFHRKDRWGDSIDAISVLAANHHINVYGTDELTLTTFTNVEKGQRIVWTDPDDAITYEHEIAEIKRIHDNAGKPLTQAICINTICELYGYNAGSDVLTTITGSATQILTAILEDTLWTVGTIEMDEQIDEDETPTQYTIDNLDELSVREAIARLIETMESGTGRSIWLDVNGYTRIINFRYINSIQRRLGGQFSYSHNMTNVTREVASDEVYTAVRAKGAPITETMEDDETELETGAYYRIDVQDDERIEMWGRKQKVNGQFVHSHSWGRYTDNECDDLQILEANARLFLANHSQPKVTYTAEIADLGGVRLGDQIYVVDKDLSQFRIENWLTEIDKDLLAVRHGATISDGGGTTGLSGKAAVGTVVIGPPEDVGLISYQKAAAAATSSRNSTDSPAQTARMTSKLNTQINDATDGLAKKVYDLSQRVDQGGGGTGSLSWPIIADKSWWDDDDSFCLFNSGHKFGIKGAGNDLGVYAMDDSLTPDPQNKQWNEGSEIWRAIYTTDPRTGSNAGFLHAKNLASGIIRLTDAPGSMHAYLKMLQVSGKNGVGFFDTQLTTHSGNTVTEYPYLKIFPSAYGSPARGVNFLVPLSTSTADKSFLQSYWDSGLGYTMLQAPDGNVVANVALGLSSGDQRIRAFDLHAKSLSGTTPSVSIIGIADRGTSGTNNTGIEIRVTRQLDTIDAKYHFYPNGKITYKNGSSGTEQTIWSPTV